MMLPFILPALVLLHLISIVLLLQGRKAIIMGSWFRHKNFMLPAVALAAMSFALAAVFIALTGVPVFGGGAAGHLAGWALVISHVFAMAGLAVLLPWTLYRVARHLLLPHKLMARWTIRVWIFMSASGALLYGVLLISALMS